MIVERREESKEKLSGLRSAAVQCVYNLSYMYMQWVENAYKKWSELEKPSIKMRQVRPAAWVHHSSRSGAETDYSAKNVNLH